MTEKNEKYPQLKIHPNGTYNLLVAKGVQVNFQRGESIEDFIKDKNIEIVAGYRYKPIDRFLSTVVEL